MGTIYRVPFSGYVIVEADSPEEALEIAMDGYPIVEEVKTYKEAKEAKGKVRKEKKAR